MLQIVQSSDLDDDGWLRLDGLQEIGVVQGVRTERHLLRPYDVLVTARSGTIHVALVPPDVHRTVAGITLLVVRPKRPESGMGHWLWYFLSSSQGRAQLARRMNVTSTITSLSARTWERFRYPYHPDRDLDTIARLVEASEAAYSSTVEAARLRRETLRDSIIQPHRRKTGSVTKETPMPLTTQELESKLWQAADILRGQIDSADYKNYIFSILFLKRLSDRFEEEVQSAVKHGLPRDIALIDRDEHEFFVPEDARWSTITTGAGHEQG